MLYHYLSLIPSANQIVGGMKYHRCKCEEAILGTLSMFRLRRFLNLVLDLQNVGIYWSLASSLWRTACFGVFSHYLSFSIPFLSLLSLFPFHPPSGSGDDQVCVGCVGGKIPCVGGKSACGWKIRSIWERGPERFQNVLSDLIPAVTLSVFSTTSEVLWTPILQWEWDFSAFR